MQVALGNYLETTNPFGLARPPASFLFDLYRYDPDLVIFPSTFEPLYRLCRRARHTPGLLHAHLNKPDTKVLVQHRLVPITAIIPGPHWGPVLIADLARMDVFRRLDANPETAGDKLTDFLERHEDETARQRDAAMLDELDQRSVSAWDALKLREGHSVFHEGKDFVSLPPPEGPGRIAAAG